MEREERDIRTKQKEERRDSKKVKQVCTDIRMRGKWEWERERGELKMRDIIPSSKPGYVYTTPVHPWVEEKFTRLPGGHMRRVIKKF
jgi:hypothetical protein